MCSSICRSLRASLQRLIPGARRAVFTAVLLGAAGCATPTMAQQDDATKKQEVLGTIGLAIVPAVGASVTESPFSITLHTKRVSDGQVVEHRIEDGTAVWDALPLSGGRKARVTTQNFELNLTPGDYVVPRLDIRAQGLSSRVFSLPTPEWRFTVPADQCIYVGRMNAVLLRLPVASLDSASARVGEMSASAGRPLLMIYLVEGALVLTAAFTDQPPRTDDPPRGGAYSERLLRDARAKACRLSSVE